MKILTPNKNWKLIKCACIVCNKAFFIFPSDTKEGKGKNCSRKCQFIYQKKFPNKGCFQNGHKSYKNSFRKGSKHTPETIKKMNILNKKTGEKRRGIKRPPFSIEWRKKISKGLKDRIPWNKGMKGIFIREKAANWQGGLSLEEYGMEFDNSLREQIRFRDKYKCRNCGCSQIENDKQLDVHHIDYDKKNNNSNNLIALCKSCHSKTIGKKRDYWISFFLNKQKDSKLELRV